MNCRSKGVQQQIESELIAAGRNGNRQATSELFERHYRSSVRTARRTLHSQEEALVVPSPARAAGLGEPGAGAVMSLATLLPTQQFR